MNLILIFLLWLGMKLAERLTNKVLDPLIDKSLPIVTKETKKLGDRTYKITTAIVLLIYLDWKLQKMPFPKTPQPKTLGQKSNQRDR